MMTSFSSQGLLLLVGLCYLLPGAQTTYHEELYNHSSIDRFQCKKVALTICNVSISWFKEMAQQSSSGNILFSPVSVAAAILMLSLGAEGNVSQHILEGLKMNKTGLPEAEIHKCLQYLLHAISHPTETSLLKSGSSIFIHQDLDLLGKSVQGIKDLYFSEVISINFRDSVRAKTEINSYMMEKTDKKIVNMVKDLKNDTFLALMNYIIWNGKISNNFECQFIEMEEFYLEHRKPIKIPMISSVDMYHLFRVQALSSMVLIYSNSQDRPTVTYFIIPDKGKMSQVEQSLTYPDFRRMNRQLSLRMVKTHIPSLSVSQTYDMESVMNLLGITSVFNKQANLSVATEDTPQKSYKVLSKAMLTLDITKTKSATKFCLKKDQWADVPLIQLNRPFIIFIQDPTNNAPLFLGRVANPRK